MTTSITRRITGLLSGSSTKRVATSGGSGGTSASLGGDAWGNTWGFLSQQLHKCWGNTWLVGTQAAAASDVSPSPNNTMRVSETPAGSNTPRVSGL